MQVPPLDSSLKRTEIEANNLPNDFKLSSNGKSAYKKISIEIDGKKEKFTVEIHFKKDANVEKILERYDAKSLENLTKCAVDLGLGKKFERLSASSSGIEAKKINGNIKKFDSEYFERKKSNLTDEKQIEKLQKKQNGYETFYKTTGQMSPKDDPKQSSEKNPATKKEKIEDVKKKIADLEKEKKKVKSEIKDTQSEIKQAELKKKYASQSIEQNLKEFEKIDKKIKKVSEKKDRERKKLEHYFIGDRNLADLIDECIQKNRHMTEEELKKLTNEFLQDPRLEYKENI
jgi:chromosome segregation ATPase